MAGNQVPEPGPAKEFQLPEWEHNAANRNGNGNAKRPRTSSKLALTKKMDSFIPPHRRYLGMSRNVFLLTLLVVILAILAIIIGHAVVLGKSDGQDLPLPTNGQHFVGDLTFYEAGLGACGETNGQSDHIVSISHIVFDAAGSSSDTGANSNDNPVCGQTLRASRFDEEYGAQRSIDLTVADRCTGCEPDDLDTTLGAFEKLAPSASGRVDVTWAWLQPVATGR